MNTVDENWKTEPAHWSITLFHICLDLYLTHFNFAAINTKKVRVLVLKTKKICFFLIELSDLYSIIVDFKSVFKVNPFL